MYYLPAEEIVNVTEYNSEPTECTLAELVANSNGALFMEYENDELFLPNVGSDNPFSINGQTAEIVGGIHTPQRPK